MNINKVDLCNAEETETASEVAFRSICRDC